MNRTVRIVLALLAVSLLVGPAWADGNPKYIFFFIGDGMASPQIHAAEAYLAQIEQPDNPDDLYDEQGNPASLGTAGSKLLNMSKCPVVGMQRTYADNRFITGSAASATAMASGIKTTINTIGMDPTKTIPWLTVAELAKQAGMKVGIVSSVSIDHATPACYYAHETERGHYWNIANQLSESGFDYFGGGGAKGERIKDGLRHYAPGRPVADVSNDPIEYARTNGYTVVTTRDQLQAVAPGTKTFAYNHTLDPSWALYYDMDRDANDLSIAEFTAEGIRLLDNPNGFFMMVEAGKIDWACHANDAKAAIMDTIAFDEAVKEAMDFYAEHPDETLIVITGDHECGGMTLGAAATAYETAYEILEAQKMSYEYFDWTELAAHKDMVYDPNQDGMIEPQFDTDGDGVVDTWDSAIDMNDDIKARILDAFGLDYALLSDFDVHQLEAAYDRSMGGEVVDTVEEDAVLYWYYEPLTVTITHILNRKAGIAWTSYSHTAVPVPVYAMGPCAEMFDGYYENTDLAKKVADAMGVGADALRGYVPHLLNMPEAQARRATTASGYYTAGKVSYDYMLGVPAGLVAFQWPSGGTMAEPGAAIDLVISHGPAAEKAPAVSTQPATDVAAESVTLWGKVTDAGGGACRYRFLYWTSGDLWISHTDYEGYASQDEMFSQVVTGLKPDKTYWFWAEARNSAGFSDGWASGIKSFTTSQ